MQSVTVLNLSCQGEYFQVELEDPTILSVPILSIIWLVVTLELIASAGVRTTGVVIIEHSDGIGPEDILNQLLIILTYRGGSCFEL